MRPFLSLSLVLLAAVAVAARAEEVVSAPVKAALVASEADNLAERTEAADQVCVAEALKVEDQGAADCRVLRVLKGDLREGRNFRVRFERVFGGAWPEKGVTAIYFLKNPIPGRKGPMAYDLLSETEGLARPTTDRMAIVQLTAAGKYVQGSQRKTVRLLLPDPASLEGMVLDAPYAASGVIQEVALSRDDAAVLTFRLEKCYKGDLERGRIMVRVPAVDPAVADPNHQPLAPKSGPAALIFYRDGPGGPFRLLSAYRGCVPAANSAELKALDERLAVAIEKEKELRRAGLVGSPAERDTVAGTLLAWQNAWNSKREVENCLACYSQQSPWRQKWEKGPEGRKELAVVMEKYPALIEAILDRVDQKKSQATAAVRLRVISAGGYVEVRSVTMKFVFESGQWLILDEGN